MSLHSRQQHQQFEMIKKNTTAQVSHGAADVQFAPENGPQFFSTYGWTPVEVHPMLKTAARLKRLPLFLRLLAFLPERPEQMGSRPWSGVCLLKNTRIA